MLQYRLDLLREMHRRLLEARAAALKRPLPSAFVTFRRARTRASCPTRASRHDRAPPPFARRSLRTHPHAQTLSRDRWSAVVAATSLHTHDETCWRLRPAPNPDEIIWNALRLRMWERR